MIEITCSDERCTYNIYHITKAFFPAETIKQQVDENAAEAVRITLPDGRSVEVKHEELAGLLDVRKKKYYIDTKIYHAYETFTGKSLAWGLLTGVRPTKLAMKKIEEGMQQEEFVRWFGEDSLVSRDKAELAWEIALRERRILSKLDYRDGYSLYVGIPFCPSICSYCSFSSGAIGEFKDSVDSYVEALMKELSYIGRTAKDRGKKLNTIYIGGGTPTTLTESQLLKLLDHMDKVFDIQRAIAKNELLEYTVEAGRPDSITEEKLKILKEHGITRISINPQTMQQKTLNLVGRKHTVQDIIDVYGTARTLGFDNINMDLIAGLPGETREDMKDTLDKIKALKPDSLTVHSLAIKRAARMGIEKSMYGTVKELTEKPEDMAEELSAMIWLSETTARSMGLSPYYLYRQKNIAGNFENVGYAKVDKAGIYNILIMEEKQSIVAAGAGSSTKIVLKEPVTVPGSRNHRKTTLMRVENVKDIRAYITRIDEMIERKGEWLWR